MKRLISSIAATLCLVMALTLSSCNPAQSAMDELKDFTEDIQNNSENWDESEWQEAEEKFEELSIEVNKHEYTTEEAMAIGKLKMRCMKEFGKKQFKNFEKESKRAIDEISGAIEELTKE